MDNQVCKAKSQTVFQRVRAPRSFNEHLGSGQERVDLLGQAEEAQSVACAQDRVGGRMQHALAVDARDRDDRDAEALADARIAQGLVHEAAAAKRDVVEPRQPGSGPQSS